VSFAALLAAAAPLADGLRLTIPVTWHQGRTAYGGLSSALCLSAALKVGGELPPLRSAQVSMIAPVAGEVEVRARVLRRGRNATWMAAEICGAQGLAFSASFVFMGPVASAVHLNDRPLPSGLIPADQAAEMRRDYGASFLKNHFDVRFALPRGEAPRAENCWWVRLRERQTLDPIIELILCGDTLPPGVMPLLERGTPISTMHWQTGLLSPAPSTRDGWWLLRSLGDYAEQGCSSQRMDAWNADGAPMMAGMQSVALFG
jgi:acyl-CoA thioesterase